ncbi:MAG: RES family NAD+ phosphorylase [Truepera sp.]|nr:RES family NAD+ phosphorylase [Truepera sp.]
MKVYRLRSEPHHRPEDAFSGLGAAQHGGRWNGPGVRLVYALDSIGFYQLPEDERPAP